MKKTLFGKSFLFLLTALILTTGTWAQGNKAARPSPPDSATGQIKDATITINYSSPSVKGRTIWGDLVPYDKAWRAGANEATVFTTSKDIKVEGKKLPAGKYTLFTTPGEKEWKINFNSQLGQWGVKRTGEANYDPANDVLTVSVKPKKSATSSERLVYVVTDKGFVLRWENMEVPVEIKN
ncbi:MAG: DUF2911 domain-containing protein [Chitinophagaceae bacterium]